MTFQILALVCAIATPHSDCTPNTAIDTQWGQKVTNEIMCGKYAQAMMASTALAPRAGQEYLVIRCPRVADAGERRAS